MIEDQIGRAKWINENIIPQLKKELEECMDKHFPLDGEIKLEFIDGFSYEEIIDYYEIPDDDGYKQSKNTTYYFNPIISPFYLGDVILDYEGEVRLFKKDFIAILFKYTYIQNMDTKINNLQVKDNKVIDIKVR